MEYDYDNTINFIYLIQPAKRYTFEQPKLKVFVEQWCQGKVLNLFAGRTKLNVDEFRVDIDPSMIADYYGDAYQFLRNCTEHFDTVILDPPYSLRKAHKLYHGYYIGKFTKIKNMLSRVLNERARVISLGYSSVGMSQSRGFKRIAICLICHNGEHNDTICLVEEKNE